MYGTGYIGADTACHSPLKALLKAEFWYIFDYIPEVTSFLFNFLIPLLQHPEKKLLPRW